MATRESGDITTDDITTERDLFWAAIKKEADVEGSSRRAFVSGYIKDEPVDYDEMSTVEDVRTGNVDIRLSPIEEVFVDQTAVKTEPDNESQEEEGGVLLNRPALEEKETHSQSSKPPLKLPFKCNICRVGFPDRQLFLRHVLTHIDLRPAKCLHCSEAFKSAVELQQHSLRHSSAQNRAVSSGTSSCSKPPRGESGLNQSSVGHSGSNPAEAQSRHAPVFASKSSPMSPSATHPSLQPLAFGIPTRLTRPAEPSDPPCNSRVYKCQAARCGKRYDTWRSMRRHILIHAVVTPPGAINHLPRYSGVYACQAAHCGRRYTSERVLQRHSAVHSGVAPYACAVCSRRFAHASSLASHARVHFRNEKPAGPFECSACGKLFPQRGLLAAHDLTHTGLRPFECRKCSRTFTLKAGLDSHSLLHAQSGRFECGKCGKRYRQPGGLASHIHTHESVKPYLCEACGRSFASKGSLTNHAITHTGEKPFKCDTCGRRFARKQTIELHCRRHTGDKPHGCETCGKRFAVKLALTWHRRTHTGEKPYQCKVPTCRKQFTHSISLKTHSRRCRLVVPV